MIDSPPSERLRRSGDALDRLRAILQADYDAAGTVRRYAEARDLTYKQAYYRLTTAGVTLRRPGRPRSAPTR